MYPKVLTMLFFLFGGMVFFTSSLQATEAPVTAKTPVPEISVKEKIPEYEDFDELFADEFDDTTETTSVYDPIEPVNRAIFWFNDKLYFTLLKPLARVYRHVPEEARISVSNFFSNIWSPIRLANLLLQLKFKKSGKEVVRFVTNSTIGILGLFDPADNLFGFKLQWEDLGQTMGYYGIGHGFYIVLPGLGPSSLRDLTGMVGDTFADPFHYLLNTYENIGVRAAYKVNYVSLDNKDRYEGIKRDAIDPYVFVRDAYYQYRAAVVEQ